MTLQELRDEIVNDPLGLGYVNGQGDWVGDQIITDMLNSTNNGANVRRTAVPMREIYANIVWADFMILGQGAREAFRLITSTNALDASSQNIIDAFVAIFGGGSATVSALNVATTKMGSRAEVLWGEGTSIAIGQVARAENL